MTTSDVSSYKTTARIYLYVPATITLRLQLRNRSLTDIACITDKQLKGLRSVASAKGGCFQVAFKVNHS